MKYTKFLFLLLFIWSCSPPAENTEANATTNEVKSNAVADQKVTIKKTSPKDKNLIRGTFMYVADSSVFVECGTGDKYPVSGDAYLELEQIYLKKRTRDYQSIYVEVKGEFRIMDSMEEGVKVTTLMAKELVTMDPDRNCN